MPRPRRAHNDEHPDRFAGWIRLRLSDIAPGHRVRQLRRSRRGSAEARGVFPLDLHIGVRVDDDPMTAIPLDALVRGPDSPTGVLALHGAGGSPELNFPFLDQLSRARRTVAPYYPGTGPSPRTSHPLLLDELADRVVAAATTAGLQRFDVLGYSLGSALAVRVATRHAERVDRLVLTAGIGRASASLRLACGVWIALLNGDDRLALGRFLAWAASSEQAWATRTGDPDDVARAIASTVPAGSADQADLVRRMDVTADLAHVAARTLVVAPRHDRLVDPAHSTQLAAEIPAARLVEVDGGHDVGGEAGQAWWAALAEHLELYEVTGPWRT